MEHEKMRRTVHHIRFPTHTPLHFPFSHVPPAKWWQQLVLSGTELYCSFLAFSSVKAPNFCPNKTQAVSLRKKSPFRTNVENKRLRRLLEDMVTDKSSEEQYYVGLSDTLTMTGSTVSAALQAAQNNLPNVQHMGNKGVL